ncbi:MAG: tetratricopeptide repeat protein [Ignavibacteriales bacterium]|nr:tetratricopeptide repeat protein [Ignavibacteriales bacterium]
MKKSFILAIFFWGLVYAQDKRDWPRVMVVLDEKIDMQSVDARLVATKIEEVLLEKGFRLVDKEQFANVTARDIALAESNPARAKEIGLRYGAEWLIIGKAESSLDSETEIYGMKNFVYAGKANAKVIITDTGEMIAVSSASSKKPASGRVSAANFTMQILGETLAKDLYVKSRVRLKEEASGPRIIQIALLGIDDKLISRYEQDLPQKSPIINNLKLRYFEKDGAVYEASVNGTMEDLRAELLKRDDLVVVGFTGTRLDLSTKENADKARGISAASSSLDITQFGVENVFPSQVNYYAYNPLATIEIENTSKSEIRNVKVSIFIPGYMALPSEQIVPSIAPGSKQAFKLAATLDAKQLYALSANATGQAKVELSYTFNNQPQTRSLVKPVTIYSRNTISWRRSESVGAFVTDTDESVVQFARYVVGSVGGDEKLKSRLPRNVVNALAVWEGIRAYGINYVSDPWKTAENDVLDLISYPRETLASKAGDCDDSSVLIASCLENIGIRTKFIATSDHIFIMFDTDVRPKNGYMISANEKDYVVDENTVWMPLETTMINQPFVKAWLTGASEYYKNTEGGGKIELIDTRKAKAAFPPANLSVSTRTVSPPPAEKIALLVSQDLVDYEYAQSQMLSSSAANLASADPTERNKAGVVQAKAGSYDAAIQGLSPLNTPASLNNLANIYLLKNDLPLAQEYYQKSMQADSSDGGVYLNFGLARYLAGSTDDAVEAFQVAISRFDSRDQAFDVLGLERVTEALGVRAAEQGERKVAKSDIFDLLSKTLQSVPERGKSTAQASRVREKYKNEQNRFVFGGRRGADPTQIASVKEFLYWKE